MNIWLSPDGKNRGNQALKCGRYCRYRAEIDEFAKYFCEKRWTVQNLPYSAASVSLVQSGNEPLAKIFNNASRPIR